VFAAEGANVAVTDVSADGVKIVVDEITADGGTAKGWVLDVGNREAIERVISEIAAHFGGLDIVVNNASAIALTKAAETDMRRFDLMNQINTRGTYLVSACAIPHLEKAAHPHILMLSPPLDMKEKWFAPHTAYSIAKFGMSLVVLGLAGELRSKGIAVNALWPRTTIATAAIKNLLGGDEIMRRSRSPDILADAAHRIFVKPASFSGNFLIDDSFLAAEGVADFERYRIDNTVPLAPDFFVPSESKPPPGVEIGEGWQ
jgi:citronellol/citronellal dehydrogenase